MYGSTEKHVSDTIRYKKESCVLCDEETPYTRTTSIELRVGYIEGAGQLCMKCYENLYQKTGHTQ